VSNDLQPTSIKDILAYPNTPKAFQVKVQHDQSCNQYCCDLTIARTFSPYSFLYPKPGPLAQAGIGRTFGAKGDG
jgi:hypothetical protein